MADLQLSERQKDLMKLESFMQALNTPPPKAEIQTNKFAANTQYLPISFVEQSLDEMFFGLWKTENFRWQVVVNEMVGSIDLHVKHPQTGDWIVRTGAAATMIRQQSGATISEVDKKIHNAMEMDMPHLKTDCIANAARSLGKLFGRDLNRKFVDQYKPLVTAAAKANGALTAGDQIQSSFDAASDRCYQTMEFSRMDDNTENSFRMRIASAETERDLIQINSEMQMFIPESDNPAEQFGNRQNALHGTAKTVIRRPTT